MATIGFVIRQLPGFALRAGPGSTDYLTEMGRIHDRYDALFGSAVVDLLERAQVFRVFSSTWFSGALVVLLISIVICTLDRTPRLWRQSRDVRVVQPDPFYDPLLPDRAALHGADASSVSEVLRRHRFRVREATAPDGVCYLYGDRHQYTKMATLFTHTGLILFLVAAAVTSRFGVEEGLVVAGGESVTVQPIGTPGLLVLRSYGFQAPGLETGRPSDFTTDLAVYRDGQLLARKVIRVNDPLGVAGFTFHENGFRPAPILADGVSALFVQPYRAVGTNPDGTVGTQDFFPMALAVGDVAHSPDAAIGVELRGIEGATILIAKQDPGQGFVWTAFASLISGLLITFYLPRRRVWARITPAGELRLVGRFDRYVDFVGEFGRLLDDLVRRRRTVGVETATTAPPNG